MKMHPLPVECHECKNQAIVGVSLFNGKIHLLCAFCGELRGVAVKKTGKRGEL